MRRKGAADVDSLRIVDVVASFQLDSLVVVSPIAPKALAPEVNINCCSFVHAVEVGRQTTGPLVCMAMVFCKSR